MPGTVVGVIVDGGRVHRVGSNTVRELEQWRVTARVVFCVGSAAAHFGIVVNYVKVRYDAGPWVRVPAERARDRISVVAVVPRVDPSDHASVMEFMSAMRIRSPYGLPVVFFVCVFRSIWRTGVPQLRRGSECRVGTLRPDPGHQFLRLC